MARSLARSTARAALRLLSSLRRFLFDLVMAASLHQLHCYPQPTPHCSLVARLTLQHAMSTTVTQPLHSPPLLPARHASPLVEIQSMSPTRKQHRWPSRGKPPGQPPPYWKTSTTSVPSLVPANSSRAEDADIVFIQRAHAAAIDDGLVNDLVGHGWFPSAVQGHSLLVF